MCDKQLFKDAVRLAEMGAHLAEKAHNPDAPLPDPFAETILAGMRSLEAKVDQLALETANLAANPPAPAKTFAAAAAGGKTSGPAETKSKANGKGKKPPAAPPRPQAPKLVLSQSSIDKESFVELTTEAANFASRALTAITAALKEQARIDRVNPPLL